jgi:hypothetical protein
MNDVFCLSEQAIRVLKLPGVKWKIMFVLDINDSRTIDKHLKNNFPNNPLMNFNVLRIIRNVNPNLQEKDIYRKLSKDDLQEAREKRKQMKVYNAKYNNLKKNNV